MSIREAREAAYWDHFRRGLRDNPRDALPAFLDALEVIGQADFAARNGIGDGLAATLANMTPEQWAEAKARYDVEDGADQPGTGSQPPPGPVPPVPVSERPPKAPPAAKPAAARTTTRRRAPR